MLRPLRPIVQTDPIRPADALTLAGGWTWFNQVELLGEGLLPVDELSDDEVARLSGPRAALAGLEWTHPRLMGILNVTPDSFSDGGVFDAADAAVSRAQEMADDGADILDIGGESTRPGADFVPVEEELRRTLPVISAVSGALNTPISIDTRKSEVAEAAVGAGAQIVNDVSAFEFDPDMAGVVAQSDAPVCLMHAKGLPKDMQNNPRYEDVLLDVFRHLETRVDVAVAAGIDRSQIIVDPGIGFGKTMEHNLALLRGLSVFHALGCVVLLGASRKRFIGTLTQVDEARDRMPGSVAVALAAAAQGVQIVRVHDVKETRQALTMAEVLMGQSS